MKFLKVSFFICLIFACVYFFREKLLSVYAKSFEIKILKNNANDDNYETIFVLDGNPILRLNEAISLIN